MDFEHAAQRLQRDQSQLKGRRKVELSAKAAREAEFRKKQQQRLADERALKVKRRAAVESYMHQCERSLGVKTLLGASIPGAGAGEGGHLQLKATSIYGQGDKIALPPSVLETLSQSIMMSDDAVAQRHEQPQQPWTFRVGILNPGYTFPSSPVLQTLPLPSDDEDADADEHDDDDNDDNRQNTAAYLDELQHRYLAYTHGTVVEFTQEEGHVGLPESIAGALLGRAPTVGATRTVEKSASAVTHDYDDEDNGNNENGMQVDGDDDDDEKTQGHLAWGAFDVPSAEIEITMVRLPKGRTAKLRPTLAAVQSGFYNLKDIKMVLEQSLIRTRATLTVGDVIHTWHRGNKFDLTVTAVTPAAYQAVSCINTDIEIDFEPLDDATATATTPIPPSPRQSTESKVETTTGTGHTRSAPASVGRRLGAPSALAPVSTAPRWQAAAPTAAAHDLAPEPPEGQREGVVTVQIRADGARGQRRFDIQTAAVRDLFAFVTSLGVPGGFQLVTRFPRRVLTLDDGAATLQEAGIAAGQELFIVENAGR